MKEQKMYECDYCRTQYKEKSDCKKCEDGHKTPITVDTAIWRSIKQDSGYPIKVSVEMSDGVKVIYHR